MNNLVPIDLIQLKYQLSSMNLASNINFLKQIKLLNQIALTSIYYAVTYSIKHKKPVEKLEGAYCHNHEARVES